MSKVAISIKLNMNMIDQARLFQGSKGQYLDATVFIDVDQFDQYGNSGMITQDVKKEERDAGVKGNILGNVSVFWRDDVQVQKPQQGQGQQQAPQQQFQQAPPQQQQPQYNQAPAPQYAPQQSASQPAPQQQAPQSWGNPPAQGGQQQAPGK